MESLFLATAPPLDPKWLDYESSTGLNKPKQSYSSLLDRQPIYAAECRARASAALSTPDSIYSHLGVSVQSHDFTVPSSIDRFPIPIIEYSRVLPSTTGQGSDDPPDTAVVYIHGGGLYVGEADSEELSCRLIVADPRLSNDIRVFSVGYRLMPTHPAQTCLSDCINALQHIGANRAGSKILLVGSSSGGQLAALAAQSQSVNVNGVVLRCPVTSDAFGGVDPFVPASLRHLHTSATHPSFWNSLLGPMVREVPRDGLERMPIEASPEILARHPRTWIQLCTNDGLYSDGLCYAKALGDAGVEVRVDVIRGWPHTFWLKAPLLSRAIEAEKAMLEGLTWAAGGA